MGHSWCFQGRERTELEPLHSAPLGHHSASPLTVSLPLTHCNVYSEEDSKLEILLKINSLKSQHNCTSQLPCGACIRRERLLGYGSGCTLFGTAGELPQYIQIPVLKMPLTAALQERLMKRGLIKKDGELIETVQSPI